MSMAADHMGHVHLGHIHLVHVADDEKAGSPRPPDWASSPRASGRAASLRQARGRRRRGGSSSWRGTLSFPRERSTFPNVAGPAETPPFPAGSKSSRSRTLCSGISPVCYNSILGCGSFSRNRWPLAEGPGSYRRWRVFHAETSCENCYPCGTTRLARLAGSSGLNWSVRTDLAMAILKDPDHTQHPRSTQQTAAQPSVREKIKRL